MREGNGKKLKRFCLRLWLSESYWKGESLGVWICGQRWEAEEGL